MGADTTDYKSEDVNGKRYGSQWVMLKTQYGVLKMLKVKTASATAKAFLEAKAEVEALVDPGGSRGFTIQRVGRDPGTEFLGEFLDAATPYSIQRTLVPRY